MDREAESQLGIFVAFMAVWQTLEYNPLRGPRAGAALKPLLLTKKILNSPRSRVSSRGPKTHFCISEKEKEAKWWDVLCKSYFILNSLSSPWLLYVIASSAPVIMCSGNHNYYHY